MQTIETPVFQRLAEGEALAGVVHQIAGETSGLTQGSLANGAEDGHYHLGERAQEATAPLPAAAGKDGEASTAIEIGGT